MLLKVTYYEQQDLFDHEGVDVEDGQTTSTVEPNVWTKQRTRKWDASIGNANIDFHFLLESTNTISNRTTMSKGKLRIVLQEDITQQWPWGGKQ